MRIHTLSEEQLQKLFDATGANATALKAGQFTTAELEEYIGLGGGLRHFPRITNDPVVNFVIDCIVNGDEETGEYDEVLYGKEVEALKESITRSFH